MVSKVVVDVTSCVEETSPEPSLVGTDGIVGNFSAVDISEGCEVDVSAVNTCSHRSG